MPKYFAYYRWPLLSVATACSLSLWLFILLGQSKSFAEWNWVDILGEGEQLFYWYLDFLYY